MLVEMDLTDPWRRKVCEEVFAGIPTILVTVTARRNVAMDRVLARGINSEYAEWFERYYDSIDWNELPSCLSIDTTDVTPVAAARQLVDFVDAISKDAAPRRG